MKIPPIDILSFYKDYRISCATEGSKHCQPGWIQVLCPHCNYSAEKYLLGYNLNNHYFNCWYCGWHPTDETLLILSGITNRNQLKEALEDYLLDPSAIPEDSTREKNKATHLTLPAGTAPLAQAHIDYLKGRNFIADKLVPIWNLQGTQHLGPYKFRIIAPIYYRGRMVSYQGRDITGQAALPYKACRSEDEVRDHKLCLYGIDMVKNKECVVVEGIVDAWRLGPGAVATFGTSYPMEQIKDLCEMKTVYMFFDPEPQAQEQAEKLAYILGGFNIKVYIIDGPDTDPGDMKPKDAKHLMKELGLK